MLAEETLLNLLDSYWFEYGIFTKKPSLSPLKTDPSLEVDAKPTLNRTKTLLKKSSSDQFLSSKDSSDSYSPRSVLVPKLQTVVSGKEVEEFKQNIKPSRTEEKLRYIQRRKKTSSRSLSDLEFEELKGFMDLGFVFSDADNDPNLVSIIPGLQRLGGRMDEKLEENINGSEVRRPYLSEAWDVFEDEKKEKKPLMVDWRIPDFGNEMELKDHLRFWAHTVASTVR